MKKICLFISFSLFITLSHAQGVFTSTGTGNWDVNTTWTLNSGSDADGVPDADDNVTIAGTHVISLTQDESCNDITIADPSGTRLVLTANILNINGTLSFTVPPSVENYITSNVGGGRISFVGSTNRALITNSASFGTGFDAEVALSAATGTITGFNPRFRNFFMFSGTLQLTGDLQVNGGADGLGTLTLSGGTLSVSGSVGTRTGVSTTYCGTVTINNFATLELTGNRLNGQNVVVNGTLRLNSASALLSEPSASGSPEFTYGASGVLQYTNDAALFGAETGRAPVTADPLIDNMNINTATANGTVNTNSLLANVNELVLVQGRIVANSILEVRGIISGESSTTYIVTTGSGGLRRTGIDAADGAVLFPIGPSVSLYHPATITNTGTIDDFTASVASATPPCTPAFASVTTTWDITEASPGGSNCALILDFNGSSTGGAYTNSGAQIVHCNGATVDYSNGSVAASVATGSGFTSFSPFGITSDPFTLPAGITSFGGVKQGNANLLRWTTASESNNLGFEIQRSVDGVNYSTIGFVGSLANGGNSSTELSYSYTDNSPAGTRQYYRLRQVDTDNRSKLSSVVLIKGEKSTRLLLSGIYPNPVTASDASVIVEAPARTAVTLTLTDINGRVISNRVMNLETGSNTLTLPVSQLRSGTYLVRVLDRNTGETTTGKMVKQ